MIKRHKRTLVITTLLSLLPILIGLLLWNQLPETMATHFGSEGEPNGWSSRAFTVFGIPLFIVAVEWLCTVLTGADPRKQNINPKVFQLILWIFPIVSAFIVITVYGYALGYNTNAAFLGHLFIGMLFIIVGNYLPKCRQTYTLGIKLPWTLADEDNWNRTHRMAGPLWMIAGVVSLLSIFLPEVGTYIALGAALLAVLLPTAYSFLLYKKKNP